MTAEPGEQPKPVPNVTVAASTNRAGTVTVRATNQGLPVEVKIDRGELRYGAQALADEVMRLCKLATVEAGARRRELLASTGIPDDILDRLGLPTRQAAIAQAEKDDDEDNTPKSWLRQV